MGQVGDDLVLTKGAAIETTAVLSRSFPKTIKRALGSRLFEKAKTYLGKVSTVTDSLTATSVGLHQRGITAMHDATEGGVLAAAIELATASGHGAELDLVSIPISEETDAICKLFHIDPLLSLSEGSLLISCKKSRSESVISKLRAANISSTIIGQLTKSRRVQGFNGKRVSKLHYPKFDPYWKAYWTATKKGWK